MPKKLIVYLSSTGLTPTREDIRNAGLPDVELPYTPAEIAKTVKDTRDLLKKHSRNIGMTVHVHIRDENGHDTLSPDKFNQLHDELKKLGITPNAKDGVGLFYTSSVPNTNIPVEERAQHILHAPNDKRPMGGTGLWGDFNFGRSKFFNSPEEMRGYAKAMQKKHMALESEVMIFSDNAEGSQKTQKMTGLLVDAIKDRVFDKPVYVNIVVGPSGLEYQHISRKTAEIKKALVEATKDAGIKGEPLIFIGGALPPEDSVKLAVEHDLDGVRFGAGECRANANCTWADTSPHLAERMMEQAKKSGVSFASNKDLVQAFQNIGVRSGKSR